MSETFDLVVVGAGMAGSTLALQVAKAIPSASILIVDRRAFPRPEGVGTVGESTVELASHYLSHHLGLHDHLENEHLPKLGLRYFLETDNKHSIENRLEVGGNTFAPTPSYQIDRSRLENHMYSELVSHGVEFALGCRVKGSEISDDIHSITIYSPETGNRDVSAKWFVDASGRANYLKKKLGLKKSFDHRCGAAWWRMKGEFRIDDWCPDPEWSAQNQGENARWFSTNHLMGAGYWVWIIPLASGYTSFGIVADAGLHPFSKLHDFEASMDWLTEHEPQLAEICKENRGSLKDFAAFKDYSYSCAEVFSNKRWAITGESGVFVDPFYSPGADFIAISNTFISDLIKRDLAGENISFRSDLYNELFLSFTEATLDVYQNQYAVLGNPLVTPLKVFWDWSFYWHFLARLYFGEKFCDLRFISTNKKVFERLRTISSGMQKMFKRWDEIERPLARPGFLDLGKHPYLSDLNASLMCKDRTPEDLFEAGVAELEDIASEMQQLFQQSTGEHFDIGVELVPTYNTQVASVFYEDVRSFLHAS